MATVQGSLDRSDFLLDRPATFVGAAPTNFSERVDEYDLELDGVTGGSIRIALTSLENEAGNTFNTFLQVIDAETGDVVADSDNDGVGGNSLIRNTEPDVLDGDGADDPLILNEFSPEGGRQYKVRVTSRWALWDDENPYRLEAVIESGGGTVALSPRRNQLSETVTGEIVTLEGQLNDIDFSAPSPVADWWGIFRNTRVDEFLLDTEIVGQPVTLDLFSPTGGFDTYLQIVNAENGDIVAFNDDDGGGSSNSRIENFSPSAGVEYRVRVTSSDRLPEDDNPYTLQARVEAGTVSLTPHEVYIPPEPEPEPEPELPTLSIDDIEIQEGIESGVQYGEFTVTLSEASEETVTVDYVSVDGTATAGDDYIAVEPGTLTFEPGKTRQTIRVEVLGDIQFENDETFTVELSNPTHATIDDDRGIGTIDNDDFEPTPADPDEYQSFRRGEHGSRQEPDDSLPENQFDLIGLSGGDDLINLNMPPNMGNPPVFEDRNPAILEDGSTDFENATWVIALGGNDRFIGTPRNDIPIVGNQGQDMFDLGNGDDVAIGGRDDDVLNGDGGGDILNGSRGDDILNGGDGSDILNGGQGDDILNGDAGSDRLQGDRGRDVLTGGLDADTFVLANNSGNLAATPGEADVITDFSVEEIDTILLLDTSSVSAVEFEAFDLTTATGDIVESTALRVSSSGRYLGVVEGVTETVMSGNANLLLLG